MGTKQNPGAFDCYADAEPDEPMFVLLGRDKHAALLVNLWAYLRHADGEDASKVTEAFMCAEAMVDYRMRLKPGEIPAGVRQGVEAVVQLAENCNCVVTVDQVPLTPLSMGNYQHRTHVRVRRDRRWTGWAEASPPSPCAAWPAASR